MNAADRVAQVVELVGELPVMPAIVSKAMAALDDPSTTMAEVGEILEHDPALAAKIVRVSNSPYYGMMRYVGTLKLALVVLGVQEVRNIILGVSVCHTLQADSQDSAFTSDYWRHSFFVGGLAKRLGQHLKLGLQGEAFLSGLLHDIGKLVLMRALGDKYARLVAGCVADGVFTDARERLEYGFTHAEVGAAMGDKWNFPLTLSDAILYHHEEWKDGLAAARDPRLAAVVRLANLVDHDSAKAEVEPRAPADISTWDVLAGAPAPIAPADRGRLLQDFSAEQHSMAVPVF